MFALRRIRITTFNKRSASFTARSFSNGKPKQTATASRPSGKGVNVRDVLDNTIRNINQEWAFLDEIPSANNATAKLQEIAKKLNYTPEQTKEWIEGAKKSASAKINEVKNQASKHE